MTQQSKDAALRRQITKNMQDGYLMQPLMPNYGIPNLGQTLNATGGHIHTDATVTFPKSIDAEMKPQMLNHEIASQLTDGGDHHWDPYGSYTAALFTSERELGMKSPKAD
ncbi:MAG: hypothetical protein GY738_19380, partial [Pseudoalteromonas sp.]|nr:hypothetical protein [Pseudoalteromonas sp.]